MKEIRMVDLTGQYYKIKEEILHSLEHVIESSAFINGPEVIRFGEDLARYLGAKHVIPCGNGTDALQASFMALELKPGDEVITTAFTFISTLEVIALLGLKPVLVDVDPLSFNISPEKIEEAITPGTKAIIPVHLYGQCAHMDPILQLAETYNLFVVEDVAQALGVDYYFPDQSVKKAGTIGNMGCTSFFPSKILGCFGDGGAMITNDDMLAEKLFSIVNHGMKTKYHYDRVGVNSRLDSLQAAILRIKLKHIDKYMEARQTAAAHYDKSLMGSESFFIPYRMPYSTHVFHQYTLTLKNNNRSEFMEFLRSKGIPSMIYYPAPLHLQNAYKYLRYKPGDLPVTEKLCKQVISLPMHTELEEDQMNYITDTILEFTKK